MKNFNEVDCMSEAKGKLLVCDRCNDQIFLKLTGTENTDGGYTVWDTFERAPDGWIYRSEIGRLCPKCSREYYDMIRRFLQK